MFIVILDHENMGTDTIIITLPLILTKIFPKMIFFGNGRPNLHI